MDGRMGGASMPEIDGRKREERPERHPREPGSRGVRRVGDERKVLRYRVVSRVEEGKELKDDGTYAHKSLDSRALFPLITPSYAFPPTNRHAAQTSALPTVLLCKLSSKLLPNPTLFPNPSPDPTQLGKVVDLSLKADSGYEEQRLDVAPKIANEETL